MQQIDNPSKNSLVSQPSFHSAFFSDYLLVIASHKKMIMSTTVGVALITALLTLFMPNIYTSKTTIVPIQEDKSLMPALMGQMGGLVGLAGGSLGGPTQADLYVTMLKSDSVKDALIERFKLMEVYKKKFRSDVYNTLAQKSVISSGKKDGVITVTVEDKDPKRAADLANAYIDELGNVAVHLSVAGAGKSRLFYEERLVKAKADLSASAEALRRFQLKNKTVDITGQVKASIESLAKLKAELASHEVILANVKRQFTDNSQEVKSSATTVENLKSQIARLEGTAENSSIPSFSSMPSIGQEYVKLMRELKVQESLVELLTKQYEMAKLTESKEIPSFQVIDKARIPDRKTKPKRLLIVLSVTFYAVILSTLFFVVKHRFKSSQQ